MTTKPAVLSPYEVVIWGNNKHTPLYRVTVQAFSEDEAKAEGVAAFRRQQALIIEPQSPVERIEVLSDVHLSTARKQQTLFEDLADQCLGHSMTDVQGACINLLLTAVQRRHLRLADAEARWDELMGRGKEALRRRYGGSTDARDSATETEIAKRLTA